MAVHPQNVRFRNVRFQNVRFQTVRFQYLRMSLAFKTVLKSAPNKGFST
jgi:hypothetical protein